MEIPNELFREAKATAALHGAKLKDLVAEGPRLVLGKSTASRKELRFPFIHGRPGVPRLTAAKVGEVEAAEVSEQDNRHVRLRRR